MGANTFTVSVTDGIAPAVAATLYITVINTNDAPVWSTDPINIADAGVDSAFSATIRTFATDDDFGDTLVYAKVSGPAWLTVATDGTLSGTPTVGDLGPNTFTVSVTDGIASPVVATLEINVAESASSLTEGSFFIVGSGSTSNLSVYNGNAGFSGEGANGLVDEAFSGAIADYRFFQWYNSVPVTIVEKADTLILSSIAASSTSMGNQSLTNIWTDTDPGVGYVSTPDYGTATSMIVTSNLTGSVDVSSLGSGTVYFFYGAYRTRPSFDATMKDAEGLQIDIPLLSFGDDDSANNTETYVTSIHFTNDGSYDTIDYTFNCTNGRFSGVVVISDEPTPNTAPVFAVDPINGSDATEDAAYAGTIAGSASDVDADASLTFAKVSGPAWLSVASDGTLSGTPTNADVGANSFTVSVTDNVIAAPVEAALNITVVSDTAPPAAPTALGLSSTIGSISLDWADNIEGDLASYSVYRSLTSGSYGVALATGVSSSDYIDITALSGVDYFYVVTAEDDNANESAYSNEVSGSIVPVAPTALSASAGIGSVALDWADNSEGNLASYTVYRSTTSGTYGSALVTGLSSSDYTDSTVANNTVYYYVVSSVDSNTQESGLSNEVTVQPGQVTDAPDSENPVDGTVTGSISDVALSDNSYQTITEIASGTTSILEHIWVFNVTGAEIVTFYVEAHHTANGEGDDFVFSYSTDNVNYIDMLTVTKTADDGAAQYYTLPGGLSGTVYVRVHDADASPGNTQLDSIVIDELVIESEESITAPNAAALPRPIDAATDVSIDVDLSWTAGLCTASHDVYFGTSATPAFQVNQGGTSFDPGTLQHSTTYYWSVDEVNATDTTAGTVWSFTTVAPPNTAPDFSTNPIVEVNATEGAAYAASIADNASDADSDPMSFTKVSGPTWLSVANDGSLSGTPQSTDVGLNSFSVEVSDDKGGSNTATLEITVDAASADTMHVSSITLTAIQAGGPNRRGQVTIVIVDQNDQPVSNATVAGSFSGDFVEQLSGVTDASGQITLTTKDKATATISFTFTVDNVTHASNTYEPTDNIETSKSGSFN